MNKVVIGICGFAIGAVVGAVGTYIFTKRKFEKELEAEAGKIKESYSKINKMQNDISEGKEDSENKEEPESVEAEGEYPEDSSDVEPGEDEDEEEYSREEGEYKEYWTGMSNEERIQKLCDEYEEEYERMRVEEPDKLKYLEVIQQYSDDDEVQLITEELFNQNPWKYDKEHYTFYDDECSVHLANDDGEEIYNWQGILGYHEGNFEDSMFRAYEDTIFIMNHGTQMLYEVTKSPSQWFDVQNGEVDW